MSTLSSPPSPRSVNRPMITLAIMLATLIQTLDGTIANVALPHMQGALSASQDEVTWILTSYIVAAAIATPLTGWFSDRFGVKKLLLASIAGFTAASALSGGGAGRGGGGGRRRAAGAGGAAAAARGGGARARPGSGGARRRRGGGG